MVYDMSIIRKKSGLFKLNENGFENKVEDRNIVVDEFVVDVNEVKQLISELGGDPSFIDKMNNEIESIDNQIKDLQIKMENLRKKKEKLLLLRKRLLGY